MPSKPHAHRLRTGRYSHPGQIYVLTSVTQNREPLFNDFHLGRLAVAAFKQTEQEQLAHSLAFVVMPDHFHWLVELHGATLPVLMGRTRSRICVSLNRQRGRKGAVWQRGYHDRGIRKEEDLQAVARYIVANPLRAGLVRRVGDYSLWDAIWV
ncbi:transposase [Pseudomonas chlororaphis]|uniref:REP-associated tyrosine transposase n=1 Tax=Pseudomonas chlororaphis TaxID=587753 RepID=UPI0023681A39|nr:transposase [Pseudomonas chlororaphis]WDG81174.1 transposase [Pseudomonas chlororaphis]WDG85773.1 transposase [Pseudomonas chlororaphis]